MLYIAAKWTRSRTVRAPVEFLLTRSCVKNTSLAVAIAILATAAISAKERSTTLSSAALQEIAQVEAEIDRIEVQTLERVAAPPNNQVQQVELLGKAMLYDRELSVNRNEACA